MQPEFDRDEAKKYLAEQDRQQREQQEKERSLLFQKAVAILKKKFEGTAVEVYLVGSITQPYQFRTTSDVDIVLKNFTGDRFDVWTQMEKEIGRPVEIILFEICSFQEFVLSDGYKVI